MNLQDMQQSDPFAQPSEAISPYATPSSNQDTTNVYQRTEKRLKRLAPLSVATTFGLLVAIVAFIAMLVVVPIIYLEDRGRPSQYHRSPGLFLMILFLAPLMYGVLAFIGGAITAWVYNFVAKATGGIKITLEGEPSLNKL